MNAPSPWPRLNDELTRLWTEGVVTAEIGRRLGISKNAVVGKAHRLYLPARPSPIKAPRQQPTVPKVPRVEAKTAVAAPLCLPDEAPPPQPEPERNASIGERDPVPASVPAQPSVVVLPPMAAPHGIEGTHEPMRCRWPMWAHHERAGRPQRFCAAKRGEGQSYCPQHRALAYQRVIRIEDEAEPLGEAA